MSFHVNPLVARVVGRVLRGVGPSTLRPSEPHRVPPPWSLRDATASRRTSAAATPAGGAVRIAARIEGAPVRIEGAGQEGD